jgi:hypothetical protein
MADHLALYTLSHKGLRARLFKVSIKAGALDYNNQAAVNAFYKELRAVGTQMYLHHEWEERAIHPLLRDEVPGCVEHLETTHREARHRFDQLASHLDKAREQTTVGKKQALGLEFYLALNRFIIFFLEHLNDEEEHVQPALWNLSTPKELAAVAETPIDAPPEQLRANLVMIIAAANIEELIDLFAKMKARTRPTAFQNAVKLAERILSARDWKTLKSRVGIDNGTNGS